MHDHNKNYTTISKSDDAKIELKLMELANKGILNSKDSSEIYKYCVGLIIKCNKVATESEIKIEFHPNGGQLSDEAGNYNKNKIDDSYTKIIKSNEKIKIDKTYSDNFFRDVYLDEHKYIRYNTKADMSGKYYNADTENSFTEDTVLLCCGGERSEPMLFFRPFCWLNQ